MNTEEQKTHWTDKAQEADDFYIYWLCNIEGIGNAKIRALLDEFKTPKNVYDAAPDEIKQAVRKARVNHTCRFIEGDDARIAESRHRDTIYKSYEELKNKGISFTHAGRRDYPQRLRMIYDAPHILYYKGRLPGEEPSVAIIGARSCSTYGSEVASMLGRELSGAGVQVISGLASGIDACAHTGAVCAKGGTYAVLGSGADVCYPLSNINLYADILKNGGILSEYPPGTKAAPGNFPVRNRIISGLADAVIVVEARNRSGSLITVDLALSQNREVMAVPGRIQDELSEGCNYLIKQGAHIVTEPEDVFALLGINANINKKNKFTLASEEEKVYGNICLIPKSINDIIEETGLEAGRVSRIILDLELNDYIEEVSKNCYIRKL